VSTTGPRRRLWRGKREYLTALRVEGFKSFHTEQRLMLRPLTVLAGANSSGKSSIVQPLLLMKQTLEAPADPGPLLLHGPNVRFTSADQFLARKKGQAAREGFSVAFETAAGEQIQLVFHRPSRASLEIQEMRYLVGNLTLRYREGMAGDEVKELIAPLVPKPVYRDLSEVEGDSELLVYRDRCFLTVGLRIRKSEFPQRLFLLPASPTDSLYEPLMGLIHVPGLRGNPERTYPTTAVGRGFTGTFEGYVASIIARWQKEKDQKLQDLAELLSSLGLTWKVEARPVDETRVELRVGRLPRSQRGGAHDMVSIADVGFGVSQALPVAVALLTAERGQLLYIEQPEIHLHPRAQRALAGALAAAARRGVMTIVETHSSLLIRALQTLVARGECPPEDMAFHWFQREHESGASVVRVAVPDRAGRLPDWPADFDDVELQAEGEFLDAVEAALSR